MRGSAGRPDAYEGVGVALTFRPVRDGPIRRNRQLGGIITSYTRDAA